MWSSANSVDGARGYGMGGGGLSRLQGGRGRKQGAGRGEVKGWGKAIPIKRGFAMQRHNGLLRSCHLHVVSFLQHILQLPLQVLQSLTAPAGRIPTPGDAFDCPRSPDIVCRAGCSRPRGRCVGDIAEGQ